MSTPVDEKVHLVCFEFKLQKVQGLEDADISGSEYGRHLLDFFQSNFQVTFRSLATHKSQGVWNQVMVSTDGKILLTMRLYDRSDHGKFYNYLLTLNIDTLGTANDAEMNRSLQQFCEDERKRLSVELDGGEELAPHQEIMEYLSIIQRGNDISPYYKTSNDRFVQYNVKECVYDVRSKYQHVQILDTVDAGKILMLDGMTNLAEADTVGYTHALMDLPKETENYGNSRVLILGGGDGALMKELQELPVPPKQIIMIDLDDAVMVGCSSHMRSVCGPYMDAGNRKGANYEVICGDAIVYMEEAVGRGEKFDFIFGDLTDTPVDPDESGASADIVKFLRYIVGLGMNLLVPETGKYMTHYNGKSVSDLIGKYEDILRTLTVDSDPDLKPHFTQTERFVPSFQEVWIYYQISMRSAQ